MQYMMSVLVAKRMPSKNLTPQRFAIAILLNDDPVAVRLPNNHHERVFRKPRQPLNYINAKWDLIQLRF